MTDEKMNEALGQARLREFAKYERAYTQVKYKMKGARQVDAQNDLDALGPIASYLDVSCGQGQMLDYAEAKGCPIVQGTEVVAKLIRPPRVVYGEAHMLPFADKSFDVVSLFDVMEHLLPGDDRAVCAQMQRIARKHILLTINNEPSFNKAGDDLHINKRKYRKWDTLLATWFEGATVTWLRGKRNYISEAWRVDL